DDTVYRIAVAPSKIKDESTLLSTLSANLGLSTGDIKAKYQGSLDGGCACAVIRTVPPQLYTQIQGAVGGLPGVVVFQARGRVYPYGADTAAITGYTSVVTPNDVTNDPSYYTGTEQEVGHAGVEQWGEQYLRPVRGGKLVIRSVNADGSDGQPVYFLGERIGGDGADIHTTSSLPLQQAAMNLMRTPKFAVHGSGGLTVNPTTGEVLAMTSNPIYDPNDFSLGFQQ